MMPGATGKCARSGFVSPRDEVQTLVYIANSISREILLVDYATYKLQMCWCECQYFTFMVSHHQKLT
jgi:hypothetical protein